MLLEWAPRSPGGGTRPKRSAAAQVLVLFAAVSLACAAGYAIGVRLGRPAGPPVKPYHLTFRLFHRSTTVNLTVSQLGLWVIFSLRVLFLVAPTSAGGAWGQDAQAEDAPQPELAHREIHGGRAVEQAKRQVIRFYRRPGRPAQAHANRIPG